MPTETTSIFNGQVETTGTTTQSFVEGDYFIIIAPFIEGGGQEIEVDAFLQLDPGNGNLRLVPLDPINLLDTNSITFIPQTFSDGNEFNLYLVLVPSENFTCEIILVKNKSKLFDLIGEETDNELPTADEIIDIAEMLIYVIRLLGGDVTALLPLIGILDGEDLTPLPSSPDNNLLEEISSFYSQ